MFARIAALATFAAPLVSALTLNAPTTASVGDLVNVTWEATTSDPSSFSLYMVNTIFHNTFAIANNVQTSAGLYTLVLPQAPLGGGYTLEATDNSNINDVYAQSGDFSVTAGTTTSATSTMSTSSGTSTGTMTTGTAMPASTTAPTSSSSTASTSPSPISSGAMSLMLLCSNLASLNQKNPLSMP
ncbi:hypothetical protein BD769DRAFT_123970 [Suillus cothurnatus]|nr:hypothetical protein BD769DRAFT_123970 [Suillus cothurnatus]